MKKLITIFLVLGLVSCAISSKKDAGFEKIDKENISEIYIKKGLYDSVKFAFNDNEKKIFLDLINEKTQLNLLKVQPKYWIFVKFKNGDERKFKVIDDYIGENDWYIKTNKAKLFQDIYINNQNH